MVKWRFIYLLTLLGFGTQVSAQLLPEHLFVVGKSDSIVAAISESGTAHEDFGTFFCAYACAFEGVPYGSGGKGSKAGQTLVNLQEMDCLTYVENLLALFITRRMVARSPHPKDSAQRVLLFARNLNYLRYDRGINCSWEDRHFYFTGAMGQLMEYGVVQDVAACVGQPFRKSINYVSQNRSKYPGIRDWKQVQRLENELGNLKRHWFPTADFKLYAQHLAQDGDIIAFASTLQGLDISHVGFVLTSPAGGLWLNHSSSTLKRVVCKQDLCAYLDSRKTVNGFFVYRLMLKD